MRATFAIHAPDPAAKQFGAGAGWHQPDLAFTMSGLSRQLGTAKPKRKRKAGDVVKMGMAKFRRNLRSIGGISCVVIRLVRSNPRNCAIFCSWHAPCNPWFITTQSGVPTMKTIYFLSAALILSLSLMAGTIAAPLGATQFIA